MSEMRIALIAEGVTDQVIIECALKAILRRPFIPILLQPEPTHPGVSGGWGGVFKWCDAFRQHGYDTLEDDPRLGLFDLILVHLDADVAEKSYADYGPAVVQSATALPALPCSRQCPPASDTVNVLRILLLAWLGLHKAGPKTVFCIPSKATEAWLASALLPENHRLLTEIECNFSVETGLSQLPKDQRIQKNVRTYRSRGTNITDQWEKVRRLCSQATVFQHDIEAITL